MKYIEFIGMPASGKSFYKKKFEKKFNSISTQRLIVNFFLHNKKINFKNRLICYLIIFYYSNPIKYIKSFFKPKRVVFKIKNKINFSSTQSKNSFFRKYFNLNQYYENIVHQLFIDLKIKKNKLFLLINKEIKKIDQSEIFKKRLYFWIVENFISMDIAAKKKEDPKYLILDEGIIHRIFLIYSLTQENKKFLYNAIKLYSLIGNVYHIKVSKDILLKNIAMRNHTKDGYIYKQKKIIASEFSQYNKFVNTLKNKLKIETIFNQY